MAFGMKENNVKGGRGYFVSLFACIVLACGGSAFAVEAPGYVGSEACMPCHLKEYKSWSKTRLASALETLKPGVDVAMKKKIGLDPNRDYTGDPKCLRCHTTGYGAKGGFVSFATTPKLAGVGCEMCHGPGERYAPIMLKKARTYEREELVEAGLIIDLKAVCAACHNPDSPAVDKDYRFPHKEKFKGVHIPGQLKYHQKEERDLDEAE